MWNEKYRPRDLADLLSNEVQISILSRLTTTTHSINFLIQGAPGIGKTSFVFASSNQLFFPFQNQAIMKFNGGVKNDVKNIKKKLKLFASSKTAGSVKEKLIIIDDADYLVFSSQLNLREMLEKCISGISFWLTCTFLNKINPTIISRCIILKFKQICPLHSMIRLKEISEKEKMSAHLEFMENAIISGNGDPRKTLNEFFAQKITANHEFNSNFLEKMFAINIQISKIKDSLLKDKKIVSFRKIFLICTKKFHKCFNLKEKINTEFSVRTLYIKFMAIFFYINLIENSKTKVFYIKYQKKIDKIINIKRKRF